MPHSYRALLPLRESSKAERRPFFGLVGCDTGQCEDIYVVKLLNSGPIKCGCNIFIVKLFRSLPGLCVVWVGSTVGTSRYP